MMPRRTHAAKSIFRAARDNPIRRQHCGACPAQRCVQRMRVHRRIGIQLHPTLARRGLFNGIKIARVVYALQLLTRGFGRVGTLQVIHCAGGDQLIFNHRQALRALGVMRTHIVPLTVFVGNKQGGHGEGFR